MCVNHENLITFAIKKTHFLRKYDIWKCLLKILAMIENDQEKFGIAVSGQSENLMGFAFCA